MDKASRLIERLKSVKHIEVIIAVIALAIMLGIYFYSSGNKADKNDLTDTSMDYCAKMQHDIEELVVNIKGAGMAKVVISWESSVENVLAQNITSSGNNMSSYPQMSTNSGSSGPIVIRQEYPKAISAVIVCQGGENASVKVSIIMSVSKLLNISADNVLVYAMKK